MKLALHRSITFWSGILVMGFICWAWWDSIESEAAIVYGAFSLGSELGGAQLTYLARWGEPFRMHYQGESYYSHPDWSIFQPLTFCRGWNDDGEGWDTTLENASDAKEFYKALFKGELPSNWVLYVPYWLLLLAVALPWSALLLWRARRRKRAAITSPSE